MRCVAGVGVQGVVEPGMGGRDREQKQQAGEGGANEFRPRRLCSTGVHVLQTDCIKRHDIRVRKGILPILCRRFPGVIDTAQPAEPLPAVGADVRRRWGQGQDPSPPHAGFTVGPGRA